MFDMDAAYREYAVMVYKFLYHFVMKKNWQRN